MSKLKLKMIKQVQESESPVDSFGKFPHCPSLYMSSDQVPEVAKFEVGESYDIVIRVTPRSKDEHETVDNERCSVECAVVAYKVIEKKSIDDMTDKEFGEYQGQALDSGKLS